jgi:hypothetical protein
MPNLNKVPKSSKSINYDKKITRPMQPISKYQTMNILNN